MTCSLLGVSLPPFLIGILLILIFAVTLKWLPSFGRGEVVLLGHWSTGYLTLDGWRHLVMPSVTAGDFPAHSDHAPRTRRDARGPACGLHQVRARTRLAQPGRLLRPCAEEHPRARHHHHRAATRRADRFAIVTESVFQWPGMGLLFIQAVTFADIP
jgi:peptide/nickel transport system permease protein